MPPLVDGNPNPAMQRAVELQETPVARPSRPHGNPESSRAETDTEAPLLPPTDRGKGAYLALLGCLLVQLPVWGYSLAYGILQEYYTNHQVVPGSAGAMASIGTSQNGIMYLMMPLTFTALAKYPRLRVWSGPLGLLVTTASLVASAYASTVNQLIATQGVLYAVGCGLLFSPTSLYLDEWFVERKGFAYGVMWSGKSVAGIFMPFLMSGLLQRYGIRTALLAWTATSALLTIPLLILMRPRIPVRDTAQTRRRTLSFSFMKHSFFWMLQVGSVLQSMGYLMPQTYLATYAQHLGFADVMGPMLLALFQLASVPGAIVFGQLGDHIPATTAILISSLGSAVAVFLLWGTSQELGVLVAFSLAYGFFAGGFSSTWSGILHVMRRQDARADTGLIFGMLLGGRGLGFLLSGPVSGALLEVSPTSAASFSGYGTKYGPIMVCTGLTAVLGAWGCLWDLRQLSHG